ncbi:MAG: FHA domain-containing protein [bacterium]
MTSEGSRLERFLAGAARVASGSALHPLAILQSVENAAVRSYSEGHLANAYLIEMNPGDAGAIGKSLDELTKATIEMLEDYRQQRRATILSGWDVEFAAAQRVSPGTVDVTALFRNEPGKVAHSTAGRSTQVLTRQRGKVIVIDGAGRISLTHTPFVIGRSPDCDLTLVDFSVSRRHAVIEQVGQSQMVIRDLGSRNRIVVDGETVSEAVLSPGARVTLGSTVIWLEAAI